MATRSEGLPDLSHPIVTLTGPASETGLPKAASEYSNQSRITSYSLYDRGERQYARLRRSGLCSPRVAIPETVEKLSSLYDKLRELMEKSAEPGTNKRFLPKRYLEEILTESVVWEEIAEGNRGCLRSEDMDRYARQVCGRVSASHPDAEAAKSYRKIFAILVLISRAQDIGLIIDDETGICDADLPLCTEAAEPGSNRTVLRLSERPEHPLACFSSWGSKQHDYFEDRQWSVLAPFFAKEEGEVAQFYQLSENDILPWTYDSGPLHQGGFSFISQIKIHPDHYSFARTHPSDASDESFAVKHFKINLSAAVQTMSCSFSQITLEAQDEIRREFEQEIEILNRFSNDRNPHLISLLAAYGKGTDYCLLFPWADYDLKVLWQKTSPGPPLDKATLVWMVTQSLGIAGGLRKIHNYRTKSNNLYLSDNRIYGRHGDIKPDNILVFLDREDANSRGTLVITDFGLTRFHSDHTKTYFKRDIPMTPTYRPPECDMDQGPVSRSFDIWSYGCVLLEFVTWYLGGMELLDSFVKQRKAPDPLYPAMKPDQFYEIVQSKLPGDDTVTLCARVKVEVHEVRLTSSGAARAQH
jgi:serine/threonine protein kinase